MFYQATGVLAISFDSFGPNGETFKKISVVPRLSTHSPLC
jgi:hypothetical protein